MTGSRFGCRAVQPFPFRIVTIRCECGHAWQERRRTPYGALVAYGCAECGNARADDTGQLDLLDDVPTGHTDPTT